MLIQLWNDNSGTSGGTSGGTGGTGTSSATQNSVGLSYQDADDTHHACPALLCNSCLVGNFFARSAPTLVSSVTDSDAGICRACGPGRYGIFSETRQPVFQSIETAVLDAVSTS